MEDGAFPVPLEGQVVSNATSRAHQAQSTLPALLVSLMQDRYS